MWPASREAMGASSMGGALETPAEPPPSGVGAAAPELPECSCKERWQREQQLRGDRAGVAVATTAEIVAPADPVADMASEVLLPEAVQEEHIASDTTEALPALETPALETLVAEPESATSDPKASEDTLVAVSELATAVPEASAASHAALVLPEVSAALDVTLAVPETPAASDTAAAEILAPAMETASWSFNPSAPEFVPTGVLETGVPHANWPSCWWNDAGMTGAAGNPVAVIPVDVESCGLAMDSPRAALLTLCGAWGALATRKPLVRSTILAFRHEVPRETQPEELQKLKCVALS